MPSAPCLRWRSPVAGCKAEGLAVMPTAPCLRVYVRVIFKLDTFYKVTKFTTRVLEFWIVLDSSG